MSRPVNRPTGPVPFAYHLGPADIVFAGRHWRRGVPQLVTPQELKSMAQRAGWVVFEFRRAAAD